MIRVASSNLILGRVSSKPGTEGYSVWPKANKKGVVNKQMRKKEFEKNFEEEEDDVEAGGDDEDTEDAEEESSERETSSAPADDRQMWDTTCSDCGAETKVPFEPDPERPVFCRDCYQKKRKRRFSGGGGGGGRFSGGSGGYRNRN